MGKINRSRNKNKSKMQTTPTTHPQSSDVKINGNDLFNNPMISSLTDEQLEEYKRYGEYMYKDMEFMNDKTRNMEMSMIKAIDYIYNSIISGQHIFYLDENEKAIMKEAYGDKWYLKFGYDERDLTEVYTLK